MVPKGQWLSMHTVIKEAMEVTLHVSGLVFDLEFINRLGNSTSLEDPS